MSKRNPFYWFYGIPVFNAAHKFVYLNDLKSGPHNEKYQRIYFAKQELYEAASSAASNAASQLQDKVNIDNALDFLKNVADNERNKELHIIKEYESYLKELLPIKDNKQIDNLLSKINGNILENPEQLSDFYLYLTKYINEVRQSIEDYKARLDSFQQHNTQKMQDLPKDDYRFRAASDLSSTLNNVLGLATKAQEKSVDGFTGKIRQAVLDYITNSNFINMIKSGEDLLAAFAAVQLDLEKKCQEMLDKDGLKDLTELDDKLNQIINDYLNADEEQETKLQQATEQDDTEQLNMIMNAAKNILGISEIESQTEQLNNIIRVQNRTNRLSTNANLRKQLIRSGDQRLIEILHETPMLKFSLGNKSVQHGNIFELIEVVQEGNTIKVRGKTGTDLLHLGSFVFDVGINPNFKNRLREPFKQIEQILTKYDEQKRKDRLDDQTKRYTKMNKEIQKQIELMNKMIKKMDIKLENLFVYHESLKLYKSVETNESKGFHGRDVVILNYIDQLYAANGLAGLTLPQKDEITLLALNLSSMAVAGGFKATLENYLSIFAGLLMFDDIYNMAVEAQKSLNNKEFTSGVTKQIHLYNLNGIYVPASMILSFTYTTMKNILEALEDGYAAEARISIGQANSAISDYLSTRPVPIKPQWTALGNKVASGTTIRINLLASFNQLMTELSNI